MPYTLSNYLSVNSNLCSSCETQYYNQRQSPDAKVIEEDFTVEMQGLGKRAGSLVEDQVCVQLPIRQVSGVCAPTVQFLSVSATKGAQGHDEDGVFGLSPAPNTGDPPSFINGLYKEGVID